MEKFEIAAETRNVSGKGASRRLRREGKIPAIVYGAGEEPTPVQLGHNDVLLHTETEAFYSHILTLELDGKPQRVVLKDMQRHPYKRSILHMDFLRVSESEMLTMRVPVHFVNEDACVGVKQGGGVIARQLSDLEIVCLPKDLPEYIEVDVKDLEVGDSIHLSEIDLPEGVSLVLLQSDGDDLQVVSVQVPKVAEEDRAEEEAEAAAAEEGGEAPAPEGTTDTAEGGAE